MDRIAATQHELKAFKPVRPNQYRNRASGLKRSRLKDHDAGRGRVPPLLLIPNPQSLIPHMTEPTTMNQPAERHWKPHDARSCKRYANWASTPGATASTATCPSAGFAPGEDEIVVEPAAEGGPASAPAAARPQGPGGRPDRAAAAGRKADLSRHPRLDRQDPGRSSARTQVGERNWELAQCFDLGDIIGVDGELSRTQTGELTHLRRGAALPDQVARDAAGQAQGADRSRTAAADALSRPDLQRGRAGAVPAADARSCSRSAARWPAEGFVEVEGPTLHAIAGGAAARPFITHHNALDIDLYLRIALELHLKRLLVGGVERVYELGRVYRNEGIDARHNPEFTMLEAYQAYGDYRTMMDLTEKLIVEAIRAHRPGAEAPLGRGRDRLHAPLRPEDLRRAVGRAHGRGGRRRGGHAGAGRASSGWRRPASTPT